MASKQDVHAAKDRLLAELAKASRTMSNADNAYTHHAVVQRLDELTAEIRRLRETREVMKDAAP